MRFRFFEYVFFASAFGVVALFPATRPFMALLHLPAAMLILTLTGIATLSALALVSRIMSRPMRGSIIPTAFAMGCSAFFISAAGYVLPPVFVTWGLMMLIATFTFGSILARRFFRRVEKDFRKNIGHIMLVGLASSAITLILAFFFATLPPLAAGFITAAIAFAALMRHTHASALQ